MESESTSVRIFFKDKQNELQGPYTEREVQGWYREKWFENSFPFYFMKDDEVPNNETPFHTLAVLRSLNGNGCPFKQIESKSNSESIEEKLAQLEKNLAEFSVNCEGVKDLEKRLEKVEKRLEELVAQQPGDAAAATSVPIAAGATTIADETDAKKTEEEDASEHVQWANKWAEYFIELLDMYKTLKKGDPTNNFLLFSGKSSTVEEMQNLMHKKVFKSKAATEMCRFEMLKRLKKVEYFYCSECDVICQSDKQILLHLWLAHLMQQQWNMMFFGMMLQEDGDRFEREEDEAVDKMYSKYSHRDASAAKLMPKLAFVDEISHKYGDAVCDYVGNINSNRAQIVTKMMPRLKQDHLGRKMMGELHAHIGDKETRCYDCKVVTGSRDEYYKHLRTHAHLHTSNAMDLITLVVNMYKKE